MKRSLTPCLLASLIAVARTAFAADAIPEPPAIFYGTITQSPTATPIAPASVEWTVETGSDSVTISATQVITIDTATYYISKVPFETRQLADSTALTATPNTLAQTSADTTYTRSAKVDGQAAVLPGGKESFTYGSASAGLIERLDLLIGETFAEWALRVLGDANADPDGDTDGDGFSDEQEFFSGTHPNSGSSLPSFSLAPAPGGGLTITFPTVAGQTYMVERSITLEETDWTEVSQAMPGTGQPMTFTDPTATAPRLFYRIAAKTGE